MIQVPLITPFGTDGLVDTRALETLARQLVADGASGLVALGTTGEPTALVTVPSFTRPGAAGVLAHFREPAAAGPAP
ncbi:dihydrodipicolinate synthase family protein [Streptomyces sp. NBC_01476]|uniref:dihydrodipicolinate synthase family protein n=1 Tax=Streptomyces sp. NBC_01476 TaxID=2903881 RepID=UPI002E30D95E|nr:dihydrodipicolinate synthase family protein [Streptomyces sp. NBC_01476]